MIFNAVTGASSSYDIPDVWDGNLTNWGFLSENIWTDYTWNSQPNIDRGNNPLFIDINTTKIGIGVKETYVPEAIDGGDEGFTIIPARFDRTYTNAATMTDSVNEKRDITATTFTATPVAVPEPSSALLLLVGAAGALVRRKR